MSRNIARFFHFCLETEFNALRFINYTIPRLSSTYAMATIVMTIKFEYLIHPGQTAECAYKLGKLMFRPYHSLLIYKYYCVSSFTCICQISLFYISLLYDVMFCVKSIKQTGKIEVARSIVLWPTFKTTKPGNF